jgi:hypothetical protein
MFRGGIGRFPISGDPVQLLIAVLILLVLLWLVYRLVNS